LRVRLGKVQNQTTKGYSGYVSGVRFRFRFRGGLYLEMMGMSTPKPPADINAYPANIVASFAGL